MSPSSGKCRHPCTITHTMFARKWPSTQESINATAANSIGVWAREVGTVNNVVELQPEYTIPARIDGRVLIIELVRALACYGMCSSPTPGGVILIHRKEDKP